MQFKYNLSQRIVKLTGIALKARRLRVIFGGCLALVRRWGPNWLCRLPGVNEMNMELGSSELWESRPASQAMPRPACRCMRFGAFQLDLRRQQLWKDGNQVKIQGKVCQALLALLESPGEIVTREMLRKHLWPRDSGLNYDANVKIGRASCRERV